MRKTPQVDALSRRAAVRSSPILCRDGGDAKGPAERRPLGNDSILAWRLSDSDSRSLAGRVIDRPDDKSDMTPVGALPGRITAESFRIDLENEKIAVEKLAENDLVG